MALAYLNQSERIFDWYRQTNPRALNSAAPVDVATDVGHRLDFKMVLQTKTDFNVWTHSVVLIVSFSPDFDHNSALD
jgi:hypothetical protein